MHIKSMGIFVIIHPPYIIRSCCLVKICPDRRAFCRAVEIPSGGESLSLYYQSPSSIVFHAGAAKGKPPLADALYTAQKSVDPQHHLMNINGLTI